MTNSPADFMMRRRKGMFKCKEHLYVLTLGAVLGFAACAIITVNVYFPEKDVKAAYKSLEDELLQPAPKKPGETPAPKPSSQLGRRPLLAAAGPWRISLVTEAFAQDDLAQRITEEIKGYPEVVAAYKGLAQRLERLNQLRGQGLAGEGKDGKVALRAKPPQVKDADIKLVEEENKDREIIMNGMAKAIVKLNKQDPTSSNLARVKPQASETFASIRRERAQSGWWIQLPDGTWKQK
jgi:hypothetical protein